MNEIVKKMPSDYPNVHSQSAAAPVSLNFRCIANPPRDWVQICTDNKVE
jgi:hypothetical protein